MLFRFAPKSFESLGIVSHVYRRELQRDKAVEARVLGFVDGAHASATEFFEVL